MSIIYLCWLCVHACKCSMYFLHIFCVCNSLSLSLSLSKSVCVCVCVCVCIRIFSLCYEYVWARFDVDAFNLIFSFFTSSKPVVVSESHWKLLPHISHQSHSWTMGTLRKKPSSPSICLSLSVCLSASPWPSCWWNESIKSSLWSLSSQIAFTGEVRGVVEGSVLVKGYEG